MRGSSWLLLIFFVFFVISIEIAAVKTHIIYWNASNPLFEREKNDHYEINVRLGDQIKIICPHVKSTESDDGAYLIIQKDSELAYMNCVLESPHQVAICNRPHEIVSLTTTVRKYRMNQFGIEMEPGMTHYIMSTSSGRKEQSEMHKKMGGMCGSDNMRMKIVVDDLDPSAIVDTTPSHPTTMLTSPSASRFSIPMREGKGEGEGGRKILHEQRRHTKKELEGGGEGRREGREGGRGGRVYSESDLRGVYDIHEIDTTSQEKPDFFPRSGWDTMKPNADEMVGDLRGGYTDYIISEHSSTATFSLILLSIILLISLR